MFCTGCGTPIQPHDHFCHHCGKQMHSVDLGHPPHRRKTAPWVIVMGALFLLASFWFTWSTLSYSNLEAPVRAQLQSIRQNRIPEAYYEYTSKQFQAATSLDQFKKFVNSHTVLHDNRSASFESPVIEDKYGLLRGILFSTGGDKAPIQYLLERQEEEWKILNMQLNAVSDIPESASETKVFETDEALFAPINEQLINLREGRDKKAYDDVSKGFKNATNYDQFDTFVKRFPILKEHTSHAFKEKVVEGDHAAVRVDLLSGKKTTPVEYHLVKEGDKWKVWSIQVLLSKMPAPEMKLMILPIQDQLKALKEKDSKKAYDEYVSEEFKEITSFSAFEAFINRFKIFTDYTHVDYKDPTMEETGGKILVILYRSGGRSATVEYTMGLEEGKWKIWGFRLVRDADSKDRQQFTLSSGGDSFSALTLSKIAQQQLQAIKDGNVDKAYEEFASPEFKRATTLEVFKQFLNNYPVFTNYKSAEFANLMLNNNIATLKGVLVDDKGVRVPIEYDFILDDKDNWKVLRIQVLTSEDGNLLDSENTYLPYFPKILIGTEVDANGAVIDESTVITDTKKTIYANIFVNGKKGDAVTVVFKHLDTNSAIKPITSSPLTQNGVFRTSFSFKPPPQGWPKGNYALEISSSSDQKETYHFQIK